MLMHQSTIPARKERKSLQYKQLFKLKLPKIRLPSRAVFEDILQELAIMAGFFMLGYGLYQVWPPLMWVICGLSLMAFGLWEIILPFLFRKGGG